MVSVGPPPFCKDLSLGSVLFISPTLWKLQLPSLLGFAAV
jgi:hypothetical protein